MLHSRESRLVGKDPRVAEPENNLRKESTRPVPGTESGAWCEPFRIKSYDVDFRRQITLESICRCFLEAAWNHAEALGVGFSHLAAANKVWVLSRLLLQIRRAGCWGEEALLRTWPRRRDSLFALRDFELVGKDGATLATGTSSWLVLDATKRRPQRIDKLVDDIQTVPRRATERDAEKIETPIIHGGAAPSEVNLEVRYSDEDLNGHVNSARYVRWVLDTYPRDWHEGHTVRQLEINYVGECRGGENVIIASQQVGELCFMHRIGKAGGQEACRARIEWQ